MAINVDIPGVGKVTIEGAASEDTARQLLNAMKQMSRKKDVDKAAGDKTKQQEISEMERSIDSYVAQLQEMSKFRKTLGVVGNILVTAGGAFKNIVQDIAKVGLAVATNWATSPDQLMEDPIRAGAELINTGIDLLGKSITTVTDAATKLAGGIPVLGGVIKGAGEAFKGAIELATAVLKVANEFMAAEFQKVTNSFSKLNRVGATFAGGMDELASLADTTGIGINRFSEAVANSRENITAMGLNAANAAKVVANGLSRLSTETGVSGRRLRDELLLLGFNYQEQGELVAEYTANMVTLGKSRAEIDRDVATGTAKYAKDLKLLSDITGEDARKRMQEARKESMRSSLMAKLAPEQREAFRKAYAGLAQAGPEVQAALVQKLSIGEVIDPSIAMNENIMQLITKVSTDVTAGSKDITAQTLTAVAETAENIRTKGRDLGVSIDIAAQAGASGIIATASKINNTFEGIMITPEQIAQARQNIETASNNAGPVADGFVRATTATTEFAVQMETLARQNLPGYAQLIATGTETAKGVLSTALAEAKKIGEMGLKTYAEQKMTEMKNQMLEAVEQMKRFFTNEFLPKLRDTLISALPSWLRPSERRTNAPDIRESGADGGSGQAGSIPGAARGNILTGPKTGYAALLHGAEAVVPLPDGRSIPVNLAATVDLASSVNLTQLEELAAKQLQISETLVSVMSQIGTILQEHRDISRDIYDVTA